MRDTFRSHSRLGLRAATRREACNPVTWAPARAGRSTLATPPSLLCSPIHWLGGQRRPPVRLLNCNRLSFTQAPPFGQESHAPSQSLLPRPHQPPPCGRAPPPAEFPFHIGFISSLAPPPRPVSSYHWRAPASGPAPCPAPWLPLSPQMPPGPAIVLGVVQFWGGTLFLFSSRRPAAEKGILEFRGVFFSP